MDTRMYKVELRTNIKVDYSKLSIAKLREGKYPVTKLVQPNLHVGNVLEFSYLADINDGDRIKRTERFIRKHCKRNNIIIEHLDIYMVKTNC